MKRVVIRSDMQGRINRLSIGAASSALKCLSDDDMETVLTNWMKSLTVERRHRFLHKVKEVVYDDLHPVDATYHYFIVQVPGVAEVVRSRQAFYNLLWSMKRACNERAEVAFVRSVTEDGRVEERSCTVCDNDGPFYVCPYADELIRALEEKDVRLSRGVCFKLNDNGIAEDIAHEPGHICRCQTLFNEIRWALGDDKSMFVDAVMLEVDVMVEGQRKRVLHCTPRK